MNKSDLIERLVGRLVYLSSKEVEGSVKRLVDKLAETLSSGQRIEIRGFGSFELHHREPRIGRNPKTGELVHLDARYVPHFKPGKALRKRVDNSLSNISQDNNSEKNISEKNISEENISE